MGTENVCYAWYVEPEMMHEMMEFIADYTIEVSKPALSQGLDIDYVMINEDMSMKNGPLIGPDKYKEFIEPHMKRLVEFFKSNDVKYVMVDTDGNCEALIPQLMDCGVDVIWPLERASDMDPVRIRKKFGRDLRLYGGVDKRRIALGRTEIDRHLSELIPLIEEGGFIPIIDHTVSPEISLDDFKYYMKKKDELLNGRF
jgi:uroporphyrinogen decarboxylase